MPGTDGLSVEFYLRFLPLLGEEMVHSLNYSFKHEHLNLTQRQGIIKVIPKTETKRHVISRKLETINSTKC